MSQIRAFLAIDLDDDLKPKKSSGNSKKLMLE